jgi:hypothetical protein
MKYKARSIIIFSLIVLCACSVYSNECAEGIKRRKEFRKARAVFVGKVTEIQKSQDKDYPLLVTLEVEKQFKGEKKARVTVLSVFLEILAFQFRVGKRYLVYAYTDKMVVPTVCSASQEIVSDPEFSDSKRHRKLIAKLDSRWYRLFARLFPF